MKTIKARDLKVGDIFTKEIKLHGREAFLVKEISNTKNDDIILRCISRKTDNPINIKAVGNFIHLRNIDD